MNTLPKCPSCGSAYTYEDKGLYVDGIGAMQLKSEFVRKA